VALNFSPKIPLLHEEATKPLPVADSLRLATLILSDIPPHAVVDYRDVWVWVDEDLRDFRRATRERIDTQLGRIKDA
jgi:hypothetical protein